MRGEDEKSNILADTRGVILWIGDSGAGSGCFVLNSTEVTMGLMIKSKVEDESLAWGHSEPQLYLCDVLIS